MGEEEEYGNGLTTNSISFKENRLSYVGVDCRAIPPALWKLYGTLTRTLDLSYNCLTTLSGLQHFTRLETLILDNNCLTDGLQLPRLADLHTLSLNKNNISSLEDLLNQVSRCLPALNYLSLLGNTACPDQLSDCDADEQDYRAYRVYVVYRVPGLKFLDSTPVSAHERTEALSRGHLMRVIRPTRYEDDEDDTGSPIFVPFYTPLPRTRGEIGNHSGAYGKCRYRYSGKHSEGNRFIKNKDL